MGKSINGGKLKSALEQFGSLDQAIKSLQQLRQQLENKVKELNELVVRLQSKVKTLGEQIHSYDGQISDRNTRLARLNDILYKYNNQYSLFEGFLAMLFSSPSTGQALAGLAEMFPRLVNEGWSTDKPVEELRDMFVRTVLGDYLRCFRCSRCGNSFMVNKDPFFKYSSHYYVCPSCHTNLYLKPDDGFLKAMVSGKQLENVVLVEQYKTVYERLKSFEQLIGIECVVCHKPINKWDDTNIQNVLHGAGAAHTQCWGTNLGRLKLSTSALELLKKQGKIL